jgi:hypothetical protein
MAIIILPQSKMTLIENDTWRNDIHQNENRMKSKQDGTTLNDTDHNATEHIDF